MNSQTDIASSPIESPDRMSQKRLRLRFSETRKINFLFNLNFCLFYGVECVFKSSKLNGGT